MEFYKIESPTTKQIFEAIIANEYVPIEKMQSKAKQIKVLKFRNGQKLVVLNF